MLATQAAAALLVTLAGGLAGDRFPRRRVLTVSLLARTTAAGVLAGTLLTGAPPFGLLLAMAAGYGCADGFFGPAAAALLPEVVSPAQLTAANAVVGGSTSAASVAAPAAAGLIVAAAGPGAAFAVQTGFLAAAAACLAAARAGTGRPAGSLPRGCAIAGAGGPRMAPPRKRGAGTGAVRQLADGFAAFGRLRWLWLLTAEWTCFSLIVLAPLAVLGPVIAGQDLGGARAWGLISSALAAGAVGGQVIAGRLRSPARPALVIAVLVPVMTAEALALGLGAPLAAVTVAAAVTGLAMGAQAVLFPVAMQTAVPPACWPGWPPSTCWRLRPGSPPGTRWRARPRRRSARTRSWRPGPPGCWPPGRPSRGCARSGSRPGGRSRGCGRAPLATAAGPVQFAAVRIVIARCSVDYAGRLSAHLPLATRLIMIKADGSVLVHSDGGSYKPLNWMSPPCRLAEEPGRWVVTGKSGETLTIELEEVLSDSSWDLGVDPGLVKDGVESHLQELLAAQLGVLGEGWRLVRREFPTAIGPVDLMCRDAAGGAVAIEIKRRGEIDGVEQLTRYLELLNRDPLLAPVRGIFAAQEIRPQARVLAEDRGISCLILDYEAMRGTDDGTLRLF